MLYAFETLFNLSLFDLAVNFVTTRKDDTNIKETIDNEVNFQFLYFKKLYNSLDSLGKEIIRAKINQNGGELNPSHLNFGSIVLEEDSHLYSIYKLDPIKVSHHKYYYASLLNLIYPLVEFNNQEKRKAKKIKGVVVAAFFRHLSHSNIYPRENEERVIDYCQRINKHFHLHIHPRMETDFGVSENRFDAIKLDILPYIDDIHLRKALEKYFNELSQ
jgi:transposase-like protein